jgi:hypothetical protein
MILENCVEKTSIGDVLPLGSKLLCSSRSVVDRVIWYVKLLPVHAAQQITHQGVSTGT